MMKIRHSAEQDIPRIMEIYAHARAFMAAHGNPRQWGATSWPPEALIRQDIAAGHSYVCLEGDAIVGTFYYIYGEDIEPTYREITEGAWLDDGPYGVVHRIAVDGSVKGTGSFCLNQAVEKSGGHLRIDTHGDNHVMQSLLKRLGFQQCGIIYVEEDNDPRLAFEIIRAMNIRTVITHHLVKGEDLNHHGTLFAARGAEWFVEAGFISAAACVPPEQIVMVRINSMDFVRPVKPGEVLCLKSAVVLAGRTSLISHISADVGGEPVLEGFITFVNIGKDARPVPHGITIVPETEEEKELQKKAGELDQGKHR